MEKKLALPCLCLTRLREKTATMWRSAMSMQKYTNTLILIKGMRNSILVQGCESLSLIEDCSKTYLITYGKISTVDFLG